MIVEFLALAPDTNVSASLPSTSYTTEVATGTYPNAGVAIGTDGQFYAIDTTTFPSSSSRFTWKTGQGTAADYQVRCDVVSDPNSLVAGGLFSGGSFNSPTATWLLCSTGPQWGIYVASPTVVTRTATITLTIRSALDGRTLASGTYVLTVKVV